ncbi:hypothetical protein [Alicyclobacillus acidiphilus]|uniref:hypothetical protein n=1 Tax=Alicyclobacillus acidiphilus TaxID=182455 RepID=UPI000AE9E382|nr:hypothetical protein [Alicyclobacillus acidiphilus]
MDQALNSNQQGIWRGWYWRFDSLLVIAIAILEVAAYYLSKGAYSFIASGELGMFLAALVMVQRAKVRKRANAIAVSVASYVIDIIFQLTIARSYTLQHGWGNFASQNLIIMAIGVLFSVVYAWSTEMSTKRRAKLEAERAAKRQSAPERDDDAPKVRVHRVKKRRGRGRRPKS